MTTKSAATPAPNTVTPPAGNTSEGNTSTVTPSAVTPPAGNTPEGTPAPTVPVNVNLGLGELIHGLLVGPKGGTPPANGDPAPANKPSEDQGAERGGDAEDPPKDKEPTKAELRERVARLEAEKTQGTVLDALRSKLAPGMEPVAQALLPTLDLSTPEAAKASVEKLMKDMPSLFGPSEDQPKPAIPVLPGALAHPEGAKTTFIGHLNSKGQIYK